MPKTDVLQLARLSEMKAALELEARRAGESVAALLDRIATEWLSARRRVLGRDESEQSRLRAAAMRAVGAISGGDPRRAGRARVTIRRRLVRRRAG